MHIHRFKINEKQRDIASSWNKGVLYNVRRFLTIYKGSKHEDTPELFSGHTQIVIKPSFDFGFDLSIGNAGSETPWDGYLRLFGSTFYWGFSRGRRLAQWLTYDRTEPSERDKLRGYWPGKYRNRSINAYTNYEDGHVYYNIWADKGGESGSRLLPRWRSGEFRINPVDILFGSKRYRYIDLAEAETQLTLNEVVDVVTRGQNGVMHSKDVTYGLVNYPVRIKLQRVERYRTKRPKKILEVSFTVDVEAPKGVPSHHDKSGGWKGDRTYRWSVSFPHGNADSDWVLQAQQLLVGWVMKQRGQSGFTIAQGVED